MGISDYPKNLEYRDTLAPYPADKCIHELFELQVEKTPADTAVIFEDEALTYNELNQKANQLADYLVKQGVTPDTLVGICLDRSFEMVISLLGTLKAGGAYLPLDPEYPKVRLAYMVKDANVRVILTRRHLSESLGLSPAQCVYLDDVGTLYSREGDALQNINQVGLVSPKNLAYVIYTSGLTDQPKGVMIEHRALVNRIDWMHKQYGCDSADTILQKTPFSFDVSVWEIFWPLVSGASVVLAKPGGHRDPEYLSGVIQAKSITKLHFVPSMLSVFLHSTQLMRCTSLKQVFCSGEALLPSQVGKFYQQSSGIELHNLYGPTEAAIDVSYWQCKDFSALVNKACIPIGRPIQNIQLNILDSNLSLVPQGEVGELHISGVGFARGYLNREDLTSEKFIPNPFSNNINDRLYKTGDLCRYLPDGNIEYVGRIDHQVKIRGFRIELGEIESALSNHLAIEEAVVLAKTSRSDLGDQYLVAYIISREELKATALRDYLQTQLPHYMIPSAFAVMSGFPLTTNGKVDRQALLSMTVDRLDSGKRYVAPTTETAKALVSIWSEVLRLPEEEIGVEHDFFALGGHSLLANQVVSKVRQRLQKEMPLRAIFETPTIKALGVLIDQKKTEHAYPPLIHIENRQNVPLSFAQERLWFSDQLDSGSDTYHVPCVYRLRGHLNCEALEKALHSLVLRHESLRTNFQIGDTGRPFQIIHAESKSKLVFRDVSLIEEEAEKQGQYDLYPKEWVNTPFNLSQDSLVRMGLIRRDANDHTLILVLHHIVTDGWSMGVLLQELSALYKAYEKGGEPSLSPPPVQYADYAVWQRQWFEGERREKESSYWKNQLRGCSLLELPTDRVRPPIQSYRGGSIPFAIESELALGIKQLGQNEGCTLFMTLLSVFNVLLHRYSQQDDICIGIPISNRLQSELESVVGFFVNTLSIRNTINDKGSFMQFLQSVKENTLAAYEHQSMPFEQVVEVVNPDRSQSYSPIFQVMFVFQNTHNGNLNLPNIEVDQEGATSWNVSKFDLTLSLQELPDGTVVGGIEYATDLFDRNTIERFKTHFITLIQSIVATPTKALYELEYLTAQEKQQLLVEWNNTASPYPEDKCIHELFEAQVEKTPDAPAVIFGDEALTYKELNKKANQLAHYLIEKGVKPDTLVGICVERSLDMVIGLLGILKAGGAYVPLDPEYPQARLAHMAVDADLKVVLTQMHLQEKMQIASETAVYLDDMDTLELISSLPTKNLSTDDLHLTSSHLAYVIYTSGSTGQPKGVMIQHSNTSALHQWAKETYTQEELRVVAAGTSVCFDLSVFEIFVSLQLGASVWILKNILSLVDSDSELKNSVTLINTVPSAIAELLGVGAIPKSVQVVNLAGELLNQQLVESLYESGIPKVFDLYGPSEDTTYSTYEHRQPGKHPCIGRPIVNTQAYILDSRCKPVMLGVLGELHLSGAGLSRGYLNRPELTSEKFIRNPYSGNPNDRLYKTGDLCRYLPDGNIEYVGRIDQQVKVRGFRIELGEIESVLLKHDAVHGAVVLCRDFNERGQQLVAYVTSKYVPSDDDLINHLAEYVPNYMVPTHFVAIDEFPLTPNGKIDKNYLQQIDVTNSRSKSENMSFLEGEVHKIWSDIVGFDGIGLDDDIFNLGADSIMAVQILFAIKQKFEVEISMDKIFSAEILSIRWMSSIIEEYQISSVGEEDYDSLLRQVEAMSDDEVARLLQEDIV